MKTVTRVNITEAIYEQIGLSRKDSNDVLDMVINEIRNELSAGNDVKIASFGTFSLRKKNADPAPGVISHTPCKVCTISRISIRNCI